MKTNIELGFNIEYFDSHNTSFTDSFSNISYSKVKEYAIQKCKDYYKIIISSNYGWEEYEKGKLTSWSYPNGCGQIKINS